MIAISPDYFRRLINAGHTQVVGEDIPPVKSVFDLKSGVRAKLVDRSGSMVIFEVERLPLRLDRMARGQGKDRGKVTHIASIINGVYVTGRMAEPADLRGDLVDAAMKLLA
jgi:hypothetical protein